MADAYYLRDKKRFKELELFDEKYSEWRNKAAEEYYAMCSEINGELINEDYAEMTIKQVIQKPSYPYYPYDKKIGMLGRNGFRFDAYNGIDDVKKAIDADPKRFVIYSDWEGKEISLQKFMKDVLK